MIGIGVRSLSLYTKSPQFFNLREAAHVAVCHDPPFRFRYVVEPDDPAGGPGPGLFSPMFEPKTMRRLYDAGDALARQAEPPWRERLPPVDGGRRDSHAR